MAELTGEDIVDIARHKGDNIFRLKPDERIGFCFPVHGWQPPAIMRRFVRSLRLDGAPLSDHYCYALCTCGDNTGEAMDIFDKELAPLGLKTHSRFCLIMPETYVCLPFMYTDTPEREARKKCRATDDLTKYGKMIVDRVKGEERLVKGATPRLYSYVLGAYFNHKMITDKKFCVDTSLCVHCGLCQKVCPVGDISLVDGSPAWHHDGSCTSCLACYHHCPRHAINYGTITRHRGQYFFDKNKSDGK